MYHKNNLIMKTMKYFFGIAALTLLTAIGVNAQQTVTQGSTHHYHVTDHSTNYNYNWSIAPTATPSHVIAHADSSGTLITWGGPGTFTLTLIESNKQGGCSTPNTYTVVVLGASHLQFTQTTSASCAGEAQDIALAFTTDNGGTPDANYYPLVVNYTVNGVNRQATFNFGDALVIPLTATDRADKAPFADYTIPVIITSATSNGGTVTLDANKTNTNTVYDKPNLNPIVAD